MWMPIERVRPLRLILRLTPRVEWRLLRRLMLGRKRRRLLDGKGDAQRCIGRRWVRTGLSRVVAGTGVGHEGRKPLIQEMLAAVRSFGRGRLSRAVGVAFGATRTVCRFVCFGIRGSWRRRRGGWECTPLGRDEPYWLPEVEESRVCCRGGSGGC